jgi:diguanylate cyclase (GGDEF)-like protein
LVITVSIGIASLDDRSRTFDDLLQWADQALYRAKQAGKNCVMQ